MDEHQEYPISDLAKLFPDMTDPQFEGLVKSIQANGLRVPITIWGERSSTAATVTRPASGPA